MDLSILIPSRNEIFLARTIADILEHSTAATEVIAVLDGGWADPPIPQHERVTVVHLPESIGQRAATNLAARIAKGRYLMKCDAHCAFAPGFDSVLLADMQDDWTVAPTMKNLHAFNWVCKACGHATYQGPPRCEQCQSADVEMDVVWIAKPSPNSTSFTFDKTMHFQYWRDYAKRPEAQGDLSESMSLQGSCWMLTKKKYFELNVCDEQFGSWGQQGVEVACKTWLSGGRVMVNKKTWYAHMFRTQQGFSFPYPQSGRQVEHARQLSRDLFPTDKWQGAVRPFSWLLEHFAPVPNWEETSGILYYTDNELDEGILLKCQKQLRESVDGRRIVCVSLRPTDFGDNIVMKLERGPLAMFRQILRGLEALETDIVFFAEHDVLYNPSHFEFKPPRHDVFYYNTNVWKVRHSDGHALYTEDCRQTSGLCAYRALLIEHYRERVRRTEAKLAELGEGREFRNWIRRQGYEPGTHGRPERVDDFKSEPWQSADPILDIRHDGNLTPSRWRRDEFRNQRYTRGWTEMEMKGVSNGRIT